MVVVEVVVVVAVVRSDANWEAEAEADFSVSSFVLGGRCGLDDDCRRCETFFFKLENIVIDCGSE